MQGGNQAVLIVEDDVLWCEDTSSTRGASLAVGHCMLGNASEAMAIIDASEEIDLLLTDVMMPGSVDGRQLVVEALNRRPSRMAP